MEAARNHQKIVEKSSGKEDDGIEVTSGKFFGIKSFTKLKKS